MLRVPFQYLSDEYFARFSLRMHVSSFWIFYMSVLHSTSAPVLSTLASRTHEENLLHAQTLVRLRWFAIGAQAVTGIVAARFLDLPVRPSDFLVVIVAETLFNLIAQLRLQRSDEPTQRWLLGSLIFDLMALTNLLFVSGSAFNPFTALYIIHVAIASVMLSPWRIAIIVGVSAAGFAALFLSPSTVFWGLQNYGLPQPAPYQLAGIWVAYVITATSVAFFTGRLSLQRRAQQRKALDAVIKAERSRRLASLAALAAGAAHEIATPLSTIAVVASDMEDAAMHMEGQEEFLEDAQLIGQEVGRCRAILDRMAAESGYIRGGIAVSRSLDAFLRDAFERVHAPDRIDVRNDVDPALHANVLNSALAHAIAAVLNNAALASETPVEFHIYQRQDVLHFDIRDHGVGMTEEVIARATEPFFTTRDTGSGMGLGLFLAYSVAHTLNANFEIESKIGQGTQVRFAVPLSPHASRPLVHE